MKYLSILLLVNLWSCQKQSNEHSVIALTCGISSSTTQGTYFDISTIPVRFRYLAQVTTSGYQEIESRGNCLRIDKSFSGHLLIANVETLDVAEFLQSEIKHDELNTPSFKKLEIPFSVWQTCGSRRITKDHKYFWIGKYFYSQIEQPLFLSDSEIKLNSLGCFSTESLEQSEIVILNDGKFFHISPRDIKVAPTDRVYELPLCDTGDYWDLREQYCAKEIFTFADILSDLELTEFDSYKLNLETLNCSFTLNEGVTNCDNPTNDVDLDILWFNLQSINSESYNNATIKKYPQLESRLRETSNFELAKLMTTKIYEHEQDILSELRSEGNKLGIALSSVVGYEFRSKSAFANIINAFASENTLQDCPKQILINDTNYIGPNFVYIDYKITVEELMDITCN